MPSDGLSEIALSSHRLVHDYFDLTYANFAVYPRSLLQSMPEGWQMRFVALMDEYEEHWSRLPDEFQPSSYRVQPIEGGKLVRWQRFRLPHYSRGRCRVARDGTVTGESFRG